MNWFQKLAYAMTPEVSRYTPEQIIMGVMQNEMDGSSPSPMHPEGGMAYQLMRQLGPVACVEINNAAGSDSAAFGKMRILAEAAGCEWNPQVQAPPLDEPVAGDDPMSMPSMGQQEKPMAVPSAEIV